MKKSELEDENKKLKEQLLEAKSDIIKLVEESLALGEDMRGRVFLLEDIDGFTLTEVMDKHNSFVSKEIFSMDNFHISRGKGNMWLIVTPEEITVPVEINDMFEGIMILRALGLKRITFQGLTEPHELFDELKEDIGEIAEMRDERVANEKDGDDTDVASIDPLSHEQSK